MNSAETYGGKGLHTQVEALRKLMHPALARRKARNMITTKEPKYKTKDQVDADIELAGRLSSITNEQYQDFKAQGDLVVSEMLYTSKDLPYDVTVNSMQMGFSPQYVDLKNLILPAITLGIRPLAIVVELTKSSLQDVMSQDYIRTAKAKGLSPRAVIRKHALKNAIAANTNEIEKMAFILPP